MSPNDNTNSRWLFLGKAGHPFVGRAVEWVRSRPIEAQIYLGKWGDPFPTVEGDVYDVVISYLAPWIVPARLLEKVKKYALNFHPGPPEYPGIGCTNFALYDGAKEFGVTCHHLAPKVDTGSIICVERFPVAPEETVFSLTQRCYETIAGMFERILPLLWEGKPLPESPERWRRKPYRRSELNELCRITPEMSAEEIRRRVRATTYPGQPGAYVELAGMRFVYKDSGTQ